MFHSIDLLPYECRILDRIGMLPDGREDEVLDGSEGGDGPSGEDGPEDDSRGRPVLVGEPSGGVAAASDAATSEEAENVESSSSSDDAVEVEPVVTDEEPSDVEEA